jgi:hypothetical protein
VRKRLAVTVIVAIAAIALGAFVDYGRGIWYPYFLRVRTPRTVADVLREYGPAARKRMAPHFARAGAAHPPRELALIVLKKERRVAVWARNSREWRFVRNYPILAASGHAGPKLREGDRQVPEGLYRISWLNPNSTYHLSMKVDYPNAFDKQMAKRDGRTNLGGDMVSARVILSAAKDPPPCDAEDSSPSPRLRMTGHFPECGKSSPV